MNNLLETLGSTFRTAHVGVGTVAYDAGNTKTIDLPVTALNKAITLRLQGILTVGTAAQTNLAESPLGLIKEIQLVADGRRTIWSASGPALFQYAHFHRGRLGQGVAPDTSTGSKAFSATWSLDHEAKHFGNPVESLFDARRYKTLQLKIKWGVATDIAKAGGGGGTIAIDAANTYADVLLEQTVVGESEIFFDKLLTSQTIGVSATNPKLTVDVPQTGNLAGIMFRCTRDAGAGLGPVPVDDLINTIALKSDVTVGHADAVKWKTLQAKNLATFGLTWMLSSADGTVPGYAYLRLNENGMFSSTLNVAAINKTQLILDVTHTSGTEQIEVIFDFFEPLRAAA